MSSSSSSGKYGGSSSSYRDDIPSTTPVRPKKSKPLPTIDSHLTVSMLRADRGDGTTMLDGLIADGALPQIFTSSVWDGRREEMEQAWKLVPARDKKDFDIEPLRADLNRSAVRSRFKTDPGNGGRSGGWENGV